MASPGTRNLAGSDDARPVASVTGMPFSRGTVPPFAVPMYDTGRTRLAASSVSPGNTGAGSGVALVLVGLHESSDVRNGLLPEMLVPIFLDVAGSVDPAGTDVDDGAVRL